MSYYVIYLPLGLMLAELLFSRKGQSSLSRLWSWNLSVRWDVFSFVVAIIGLDYIIMNLYSFGLLNKVYSWSRQYEGSLFLFGRGVLYSLAMFFIYDFCVYWFHRFQHRSQWLWFAHKYHHTATELNAITWMRSHPIGELVRVKTLLGIGFGFLILKTEFLIFHVFLNVLSHSRLDTNFGLIGKYIFITPRYHHRHHELDKIGCNYSQGLVVWDRLFGSYVEGNVSIYDVKCGLPESEGRLTSFREIYVMPFLDFAFYPFRKMRVLLRNSSPV